MVFSSHCDFIFPPSSFANHKDWTLRSFRHASQGLGETSSCGVFCALFAECLLGHRKSFLFDTSDIQFHRHAIWRSMVEDAAESASLCRTCGEKECPQNIGGNVDKWVCYLQQLVYKHLVTYENHFHHQRNAIVICLSN